MTKEVKNFFFILFTVSFLTDSVSLGQSIYEKLRKSSKVMESFNDHFSNFNAGFTAEISLLIPSISEFFLKFTRFR